jgi:hypothetical protein
MAQVPLKINSDVIHSSFFDDVSGVYSKLQRYDDAYMNYVMCLEARPQYTKTGLNSVHFTRDASYNYLYNASSCTPPDATVLMAQIQQLQGDIELITHDSAPTDGDISLKYNTLLQLRKELDRKLSELYQLNNSIPVAAYQEVDSAIYATLLWATLATCLIYYITTL